MSKWILIYVCEREISINQFNSFEDAQRFMINSVKQDCLESAYGVTEDEWNDMMGSDEHFLYDNGFDILGIGYDWAYSNCNNDYKHDWKIVKVE